MSGARTVIVTTKNEGPFLLEWVLYHRLIGFDNIVVFANDCEDGSDKLLKLLDKEGVIRFFDNSELSDDLPADPQNRAYRRAFEMDHVQESEWVLVIDADEFFNIHAGEGRLDDLFAAVGEADVISGTWRVFGNAGLVEYRDDLVTQTFTRCAPVDRQVSFRHFGMKSMFRPEPVHRLGIHRPFLKGRYKKPEGGLRWVNGSGVDVTRYYLTKGWSSSPATVGYALCQVNHYMIKSNELFLMKRYRGTANSQDQDRINFDYYDAFNSNHVEDRSITRWSDAIREAKEALIVDHPEIGKAHDKCVTFFEKKIGALIKSLKKDDPEVWEKLIEPKSLRASIDADVAWLKATPPLRQKVQERAGPKAAETLTDEDDAPRWLADLRRSDYRRGFYHSDDKFAAHFAERERDVLMISFDNLSNVNDKSLSREGWGYSFYRDHKWSHLGIMSFEANWYRDPRLFDWFEARVADGAFNGFGKVVLTGTSMGAYGAMAFARLFKKADVLAFSPQTSLDGKLAPWETRFASGRKQDWSGRYRDAAQKLKGCGNVFVLYDPGFELDRKHAERVKGANVHHLKTWFSSHKSALFLRRANLLKPLVEAAVAGQLDEQTFYKLYRQRRSLPWYVNGLTDAALGRGHHGLVGNVANVLEREGRVHLAKSVRQRLTEAV